MMSGERETESLLPHRRQVNYSGDVDGEQEEELIPMRPLTWVSVEPMILVTTFGLGLHAVLQDKLWLQKICELHFHFGEEVCSELNNGHHSEKEKVVQQLASRYRVYAKVVQQVPAMVMVMVMGMYSDALDRRLPLIWCHVGFLLMALTSAVNVYWWWLPPEMLLLNYLMLGAGGGILVLRMGVETYVSAASVSRGRTTRPAVLKIMAVIGRLVGQAVAVQVFLNGHYLGVFGAQSLAFIVSIVYMVLWLKKRPGEVPPQATHQQQQQQQQQQAVMSLHNLKRAMLVVCQAQGHSGRRRILVHLCIIWLITFVLGSLSFLFFYVRERFHWNYETFTMWSVIDVMVSSLGLLVAVPVITYICQARDGMLGLLGSFSLIFKNVLFATSPRAWVIYLAAVVGMCSEVVGVASKGAISKLVGKQHLGAVFAVVTLGEGIVQIPTSAVFAALYTISYTVFPEAVFVLSASCSVLISCVFVWEITVSDADSERDEDTAATDHLAEAPSSSSYLPVSD